MSLDEARNSLKDAALAYACSSNGDIKHLCMAALAYAEERSKVAPKPQTLRVEMVIPFGRSKNTPISAAETKDLEWVAGALQKSIDDPAKERWADGNRQLLQAIESELSKR